MSKQDLHIIITGEEEGTGLTGTTKVIAHAFLWSAQDDVPELGLAVADEWQGRGLGKLLLGVLEACARHTGRLGIELTTMQNNEVAYKAYCAAGYEYLGIIRNPIGVDVTAAFRGEVVADDYCDERSMIKVRTISSSSYCDERSMIKVVLSHLSSLSSLSLLSLFSLSLLSLFCLPSSTL
jgi:GNAT superfamily N-acetyltransferase